MLLDQFDQTRIAVINPDIVHAPIAGFPDTIVGVFSWLLFARLVDYLHAEPLAETRDVDGVWPVYGVQYKGVRLAFVKARLGAPACVGTFEDVLAMGGKRIILVGSCGVLDASIADCGIIIPTAAIRDEGTGYHYCPPDRDVLPVNATLAPVFEAMLAQRGIPYRKGITWTTDAFYRETPTKVAARKRQGAVCVEMECSAMQALCNWRGVEFFQYLYAGDNLDASNWQRRSLSEQARLTDKEQIVLLAFDLAASLG